MSFVQNNVVKMDWEKSGFLTKNRGKYFLMASHEYKNDTGEIIAVFFTTESAFIFRDDDGLWSKSELISFVKDNFDGTFPVQYSQYLPLVNSDCEVKEELLEELGLKSFTADIINRLQDVAPYGEETERDSM